jgi:hypothetical protein
MEKLKSLTGTGKVYQDDTFLGDAPYQLDVYQEFIEGNTLQGAYRIPGLKSIVGYVKGTFPAGTILKLVTAQGQTLKFFVADGAGGIKASGPLLNLDGTPVDLNR